MNRGIRRFWLSLGFAAGFVIRDLMEDDSCVRNGIVKLYQNARKSLKQLYTAEELPSEEKEEEEKDKEEG